MLEDLPLHKIQIPLGDLLWQADFTRQQLVFVVLEDGLLPLGWHGIPHGGIDGSGDDAIDTSGREVYSKTASNALVIPDKSGTVHLAANDTYFDGSCHAGSDGPSLGGFVHDGTLYAFT